MGFSEAKLFQGNEYVQYFSVFLVLSLIFLAVIQFSRSVFGVTVLGSLVRLMASMVLLVQVFTQGESTGVFSRYLSFSDVFCIVVGSSIGFLAGYSFFSVAFSDVPLAFGRSLQVFLDLSLASCVVYQLISE